MSSDELTIDEKLVLSKYRAAKQMGHSDLEVCVKDGSMVRMNITEKVDLDKAGPIRRLKENENA